MSGAFSGGNRGTARHGTHSGYVIHRKYGEDACDACKAAHLAWKKEQRQRIGPEVDNAQRRAAYANRKAAGNG